MVGANNSNDEGRETYAEPKSGLVIKN